MHRTEHTLGPASLNLPVRRRHIHSSKDTTTSVMVTRNGRFYRVKRHNDPRVAHAYRERNRCRRIYNAAKRGETITEEGRKFVEDYLNRPAHTEQEQAAHAPVTLKPTVKVQDATATYFQYADHVQGSGAQRTDDGWIYIDRKNRKAWHAKTRDEARAIGRRERGES